MGKTFVRQQIAGESTEGGEGVAFDDPRCVTNTFYRSANGEKVVLKVAAVPGDVEDLPTGTIHAVFFVYDVSSWRSFKRVDHWQKLLESRLGCTIDKSRTLGYLLGFNDVGGDADHRKVSENEARYRAEQRGLLFSEIAREGDGATAAFHKLVSNSLSLIRNQLGRGGQGSVVPGLLSNGMRVAIKVIKNTPENPDAVYYGLKEVRLLQQCQDHPNVVQLLGATMKYEDDVNRGDNDIEIILRYYQRGSLFQQLQDGKWDPSMAPKIIRQLAEAVLSLHRKLIIHRDIKPGNILLSDEGNVILCDFGIATQRDEESESRRHTSNDDFETVPDSTCGTLPYMAPEMCKTNPNYDVSVDVWAIGCVLLNLLGYDAWDPSLPYDELRHKIARCRGRPDGCPKQGDCTSELWEVLTKVFRTHGRISCEALLKLPWLRNDKIGFEFRSMSTQGHSHGGEKTALNKAALFTFKEKIHTQILISADWLVNIAGNSTEQIPPLADCIRDVEINANSRSWNILAIAIEREETSKAARQQAFVGGIVYSKVDCLVRSLEIDPANGLTWANLGSVLDAGAEITVNAETYTKQTCYIRALELVPDHSGIWNNLGTSIAAGEKVSVSGVMYSRIDCLVRSLEIDPANGLAWANLGNTMAADADITVNAETYTKQTCYIRALELVPDRFDIWNNLGNTVAAGEKVSVSGVMYSRIDCLVRSLEVDPANGLA